MLEKCKRALRITDTDFDDEINDLIDACKEELSQSGISNDVNLSLYEKAVITYVKRDFGWNNDDYEKLNDSYNQQKIFLMRIGDKSE